MATTPWTQRAVLELFPELLARTGRGQQALLDEFASELGIEPFAVGALNVGYQVEDDGRVTPERVRFRSPYSLRARVPEAWQALVRAGQAEEITGGWRITALGRRTVQRLNAAARARVGALDVPAAPARRAADAFGELAAQLPTDSPRVAFPRRIWLSAPEQLPDLVRLRRALVLLWARRDDCHIGAWEDAGYEGPTLDVLSQVWEGHATIDVVAKALANKQGPDEVERNVETLVRRGDLERVGEALRLTAQGRRSRDAIEAETDRRYFVRWPERDELARMGDDLKTIVDALV